MYTPVGNVHILCFEITKLEETLVPTKKGLIKQIMYIHTMEYYVVTK